MRNPNEIGEILKTLNAQIEHHEATLKRLQEVRDTLELTLDEAVEVLDGLVSVERDESTTT